jgi:nucleoside-diphosphate-sugar epimerase
MTSVLVTGAGGFIGRRVVSTAVDEGFDVIPVARRPLPGKSVTLDLTGSVDRLPAAGAVFHLAGGYAGASLKSLRDGDLRITQNLIDWGMRSGVRTWVFASAAEVYGSCAQPVTEDAPTTPVIPYGRVKLEIEREFAMLAEQLPAGRVAVLRIGEVYGREGTLVDEMTERFLKRLCPWFGNGRVPASFVHVDDVARAFIVAAQNLDTGFHVINVADERPTEWREFLEHFASLLGTRGPIGLPLPVSFSYATASAVLDRLHRRRPTVTRNIVKLLTTAKPMSNAKLRTELGLDLLYPDYRSGLRQAIGPRIPNAINR